jgi:hypothetical protein
MRHHLKIAAIVFALLALPGPASAQFVTPTSTTLVRPNNATAYSANAIIASSATAGSVAVPSFTFINGPLGAAIGRVRIWTNITSGWDTVTLTVRLWSIAPTYTNGDGGAYAVATGTAQHIGTFTCTLKQGSDGAWASCAPAVGNFAVAGGSPVYWDLQYTGTASLTPAALQQFKLTPELTR